MPILRNADQRSLSIVIPFYGDPKPTQELCNTLLSDSSLDGCEIIVSDDCSPTPFPRSDGIRVVRRERNGGFAAAVNTGCWVATGDDLLVLNSDLTIEPGKIAEIRRHAAPWMPAIVSSAITAPDGHNSWTGRHFTTITHQTVEWLVPLARWRHLPLLHELVGHDTRCNRPVDTPTDWVVGAFMLMPRDVFQAVGAFDEGFYMNAEEVDFQRRARDLGIPSVVIGGISVEHEGGGSSASEQRRGWVADARLRYAEKWYGPYGEQRQKVALLGATAINLLWNTARKVAGADVNPLDVVRYETQLVLHPEQWVAPEHQRPKHPAPCN